MLTNLKLQAEFTKTLQHATEALHEFLVLPKSIPEPSTSNGEYEQIFAVRTCLKWCDLISSNG